MSTGLASLKSMESPGAMNNPLWLKSREIDETENACWIQATEN